MKEDGKEWPERLEEIMRTIFCSLENYGKQSVIECKIYGVLRAFVVANHKTLSNRKRSLPWRVRTYFSDIAMGIQTGQFNFFWGHGL